MSEQKGRFITLEGGEGVGKTTNINFITAQLDAAAIPWVKTREPGGTPFAEAVRNLLLASDTDAPSHLTELLLMFAGRADHLDKVIRPALAKGIWVICDRFTDASYAYQGGGRGQSETQLALLEKLVHSDLQPDLTLLLDMPVEAASLRVDNRGQQRDRFEQEQLDFFQRVRDAYLQRAHQHPLRFRLVDASLNLEAVKTQVGEYLKPLIDEALATRSSV
ncbi:dTMP kinase [Marinospirillum insulare]|uniref:Thymidylate kinase n=1 Tax=Marinospirillum insulare TaxID=217169 RepID=A0ABQ5ZVS9_9GAMM|nr:dTMP kinase [Marinospirillum insulare]GLR64281.1 thymidylate kinase [Marinospirillum insulare]